MKPIARIETNYREKFGIPRQSGLVNDQARIIFEPGFGAPEAVRGLDEFSHIWLIWVFSENIESGWSPTVRPPRLGGNKRMGVFATRSPFRPNPIGLSAVRLERIEFDHTNAPVLHIKGADLMHGTPILDIKPYIPYSDSIPDANPGFASEIPETKLNVIVPDKARQLLTKEQLDILQKTLSLDPRPSYQNDRNRIYGMLYMDYNVQFHINGDTLTIIDIHPESHQ